jgi:hypothetical protein
MDTKYTNSFHRKTLKHLPKIGFLDLATLGAGSQEY